MSETVWRKKLQRPIGVNVVLTLILISSIRELVGFFLDLERSDGNSDLIFVVLTFLVIFGLLAGTVWAFFPHNEARLTLLATLLAKLGWYALLSLSAITDENPENDHDGVNLMIRTVISGLLAAGVVAYFFSSGVVAYYKQDDGN